MADTLQIWDRLKVLVIDQYKDSANLLSLLEKTAGNFQDLATACEQLSSALDVDRSQGTFLDCIGKLRGVERKSGESDSVYRDRLHVALNDKAYGTPDVVIERVKELSGTEAVTYFEEVPATYFVYTPEGRQVTLSSLRKVSPAGVLGLPAAALKTASGKFIVDGSRLEWNLTDDDGETLTSDDGDTLTWLEKPARKMLCVARDENIGNTVQKTVLTEDGKKVLTEDGLVLRTDV